MWARRGCRARRWSRRRLRWRPSAGCPWSRCGPSCVGRARTVRSADRGEPCPCRCREAGPGSRSPEARSGWATTSHPPARRRCGGATPPHRATDRRRGVERCRRLPVTARATRGCVVDLPAPFGPRNPVIWPGATVKSNPSSALVRPNTFDRPRISTATWPSPWSAHRIGLAVRTVIAISFSLCAERNTFLALLEERLVHRRVAHQPLGVDLERGQHHLLAVVAKHHAQIGGVVVQLQVQQEARRRSTSPGIEPWRAGRGSA